LIEGHVLKKGKMRVYRNNEEIADVDIEFLKHYKDDASRVDAPKECGIKARGSTNSKKEISWSSTPKRALGEPLISTIVCLEFELNEGLFLYGEGSFPFLL
jgi:hypothetical protein